MSFPTVLPAARPTGPVPALRWGILGTGWIADKFTRSVKAQTNQIIAAVGSRERSKAVEFAEGLGIAKSHGSYEDLLNDKEIDVIYVATPHNYHHPHTLLALNAGKHVLVEKPAALNRAQAAEMVDLASRKNLFFAEALWTYFLPKFDVIEQLLQAEVLGEILSVYTDYGEYLPPEHRLFDPKLAGGPLLDLGTYPVSFLTKLLGVPDKVTGIGQVHESGVVGQLAVVMANAKGNLGTMATSPFGFSPTNAVVLGTHASLWFDTEFLLPGSFTLRSQDGSHILAFTEPRTAHLDGLHHEATEVARAIASNQTETPKRTPQSSLDTLQTLDLICEAVGIDFSEASRGNNNRFG